MHPRLASPRDAREAAPLPRHQGQEHGVLGGPAPFSGGSLRSAAGRPLEAPQPSRGPSKANRRPPGRAPASTVCAGGAWPWATRKSRHSRP